MAYVKTVQCSQYLMRWEYLDLPEKIDISLKTGRTNFKKDKNNKDIRSDSYLRTKRNVKYSLLSNINVWKSFFTLTFANEPENIKDANKILSLFLNKMRKKYPFLKYLGVIERGSKNTKRIHYHFMFSHYFNKKYIANLWEKGLVLATKIYNKSFKLAGYLGKYLNKQNFFDCDFAHYRKMFKSENLASCIITKGISAIFKYCKSIVKNSKILYNFFNKDLNLKYTVYEFI